jgi:hypothetical protein
MIRQTLDRIRKLKLRHRRPRRRDTIGPPLVIDLDELEAARRNPRLRETLEQALAYGERVEAQRRKTRKRLAYEGPVYVRPIGRGIVLDDGRDEPHLDDWIETWLIEVASGRSVSGGELHARLRIVVEYVGQRAQVCGRAD